MDVSNPYRCLHRVYQNRGKWYDLSAVKKLTYRHQYHLHQLKWIEGQLKFSKDYLIDDFKEYLGDPSTAVFYVLGREKLRIMQEFFPMLIIMDYSDVCEAASAKTMSKKENKKNNEHFLTFNDIPHAPDCITCPYGTHSRKNCAYLKCVRLQQHYMKYPAFDTIE